jgi:hypothetical protein
MTVGKQRLLSLRERSCDHHALTKDGGDDAAFKMLTRRQQANDVTIGHFWGSEANLMPIWTILDMTPEGRGTG